MVVISVTSLQPAIKMRDAVLLSHQIWKWKQLLYALLSQGRAQPEAGVMSYCRCVDQVRSQVYCAGRRG